MSNRTPSAFQCPECKTNLFSKSGIESKSLGSKGLTSLTCIRCGRVVSMIGGVPRFVPDENYADSFGFQWNQFGKTQLDSHTGQPLTRNRLFHVTDWPSRMEGERILEAGCGAGRFTEILATTEASVFSFDLSSAVDANFANNGHFPNVQIFQASIFEIPLEESSFDRVMCMGVLQHTPDPDRAFKSLAHMVKPGGHLAVDVYARSLSGLISWKYLLRPFTVRMSRNTLLEVVVKSVDLLLPLAITLRRFLGAPGARLLPILQYSHLGLSRDLNRQWAILDTFDMYSPAHDHPRSESQVRQWFVDAGFEQIVVGPGPNGVIGRGRKPYL